MLENLIMGHLEKQIEVRCFKNAMNSFLVNNYFVALIAQTFGGIHLNFHGSCNVGKTQK